MILCRHTVFIAIFDVDTGVSGEEPLDIGSALVLTRNAVSGHIAQHVDFGALCGNSGTHLRGA